MIITYYGLQFFKFQVGDFTLAYNPFEKTSSRKPPKFGADVALSSLNHPDFNALAQAETSAKKPFSITGPGEYEIQGAYIKGASSKTTYDGEDRFNTVYYATIEGISLCLLGAVQKAEEVTEEMRDMVGGVDVLFVPVSGGDVLSPRDAHKLALSFNPSLIIPMHFESDSSKELAQFLEEAGIKQADASEKLTLKKKDIDGKEGDIAVLSVQ